ncbi:zwei Ig domain protein zig-8 [Folsomia candida]|uniref:zwei Ig domain protein zig-8 n=1 Tax=Folsomia candida TaxID=158441 RepID=UPI000B8F5F19|nr:zwei Ig domain protein zig-8 [Folsomia candida]
MTQMCYKAQCCRNLMEVLKSLRWIFLLIVLTDSVIGHVSDGSNPLTKKDAGITSIAKSDVYSKSVPPNTSTSSSATTPIELRDSQFTKLVPFNNNGSHLSANSTFNVDPEVEEAAKILELQRQGLPWIDKAASPNVTALLGKTAYLNCRVKNLADKTLSWVRHRDIHLLTVGRYTYTTDQRFRSIHTPHTDEWTLQIRYPQLRDKGIYECQVSATPTQRHFIHLTVVEPVTEVAGGPDLYIDRGSTINLTCTVKYSPEPPHYIIWNHNNAIISYSSPRGGVSVVTEKGETTVSHLLILMAKNADSGRYSCSPSNAAPHGVNVHVLSGEKPEAMQTGGQMPQQIPVSLCLLSTAILLMIY